MNPYAIPGIPSIDQVVAESFGVEPKQLTERTRKREVVDARHFAMYYRKKHLKQKDKEIGHIYDRDHATVIFAAGTIKKPGKVEHLMVNDRQYRDMATRAMKILSEIY